MKTIGVQLRPFDVLFFRDGRPFSASSRVVSGLPTPQILAGAWRTALFEKYKCPFPEFAKHYRHGESFDDAVTAAYGRERSWIGGVKFRGPWLCKLGDGIVQDVYVPAPATVHAGKKGTKAPPQILKPTQKSDVPKVQGLRPMWANWVDATDPFTGFLNQKGLSAVLNNTKLDESMLIEADTLYAHDHRTGIEIDPDRLTAADTKLYSISFLALKREYGFYAEILLPDAAPPDALATIESIAFGGEGKRVSVSLTKPVTWPTPTPSAKQKICWILTTPAVMREGWKPLMGERKLASAAVPSPIAISGWDLAKGGPKPTRFAAPAGSVYFLDDADPHHPDSLAEGEDAALGYGCFCEGVWNDE